jgi:hypothetical protein
VVGWVGGGVGGEIENKANSAQLELELWLSLAKSQKESHTKNENVKKVKKMKKVKKEKKGKRDKEFKLINVVIFGKYKNIVHECCSFQNQPWRAYYVSERSEPLHARSGRI